MTLTSAGKAPSPPLGRSRSGRFGSLFIVTAIVASLGAARVARAQGAPPPAGSAAAASAAPSSSAAAAPPAASSARAPLVPPAAAAGTGAATPPPVTTAAPATPPPAAPNPDVGFDKGELARQGYERPSTDGSIAARPNEVFSEDWWGRTRPILELHGYFRTRAELFHNFALGRHDDPSGSGQNLWPQPLDNSYTNSAGDARTLALCGDDGKQACKDQTEAGANMRFRINPELHISDNLSIKAQIDAFDNLVLGSTPDAYAIQPGVNGGYAPTGNGYNGYAPLGGFSTTQGPPTAGINSFENSVAFKRAWAEYLTPVGQLRFGRMPNQWGLGMLANSGDDIDSDYQSTSDRIMFVTGIKSLDLYFAGMWDFVSSGPTNASAYDLYGGQPTNTCNLCNVNQWGAVIVHKTNPETQKLTLARGGLVLNGGVFTILRSQYLDVSDGQTPITADTNPASGSGISGLERRDAWALIPDLWFQALYRKFRFEAEGAAIIGQLGALPGGTFNGSQRTDIRQWGLTTQTEYTAVEDKLHLNFGFGYASGDPWVEGLNPGSSGLQPELNGKGPISTFHFHPDYRVDLIFFRHILSRVEGAYYFRPSVNYDFLRNANGQKFGGGAAFIWSRASEFIQTPGNKPDLGVELDLQLYYQAKDGSLNNNPSKVGGFYTMLQYGVFFPLGGLGYLPKEQAAVPGIADGWDLSSAQTVRWYLGVVY